MMMPDLERLCLCNGLAKEELERPADDHLLDQISTDPDLEVQLECLATSIDITTTEVYDIRQSEPSASRCRALFKRWKQRYGSEATYAKLIKGLEDPSNGRRDLTEVVLKYVAGTLLQEKTVKERFRLSWRWRDTLLTLAFLAFILGFVMIFYPGTYLMLKSNYDDTIHRSDLRVTEYVSIPQTDDIPTSDTDFDHYNYSDVLLKQCRSQSEPNTSRCTDVYSDLPNILSNVFIGRSKDIEEIARRIQTASIVNVNGAPGFGKSSVVIRTGYVLVDNGTSVRYIDVEEQLPLFSKSFESDNYEPQTSSYNASHHHKDKKTTAVLHKMSSISHHYDRVNPRKTEISSSYIKRLILWSKKVECFTVLILDNCDNVITTYHKDQFINLVLTLIRGSRNYIHVVFVTQAKVLLVDSFEQWTVREMTTKDSIELLQTLAPGITSGDAETVSNFVERCPLALKVVGNMLHLYGGDTLTKKMELELQRNPIDVLDHADQRRLQFRFIMELAISRIEELLTSECDYSVSLFPGTFSWEAGTSILDVAHSKVCLDTLIKYSLLDEYFHYGYVHRYRMHRLIKEFLKDKVTDLSKQRFEDRFSEYFQHFLMQHVMVGLKTFSEIEEYELSLETLNVHHYIGILIAQERELTSEELAILSYGQSKDLVSFTSLEPLYKHFVKSLTQVCLILDSDAELCGKFYSRIIENLYSECKCENVSRYFKYLLNSSCPCTSPDMNGVFQCQMVHNINHTKIVWVHLSMPVQEYLSRVMFYNCDNNHVYTINFLIFFACFSLSRCFTDPRDYGYPLITAYAIASILHIAHLVRGEHQAVTIIETFLKSICYKMLLLLFLCMLFVVRSIKHMLIVVITLTVLYYIVYILWCDTLHCQGCASLPLCQ